MRRIFAFFVCRYKALAAWLDDPWFSLRGKSILPIIQEALEQANWEREHTSNEIEGMGHIFTTIFKDKKLSVHLHYGGGMATNYQQYASEGGAGSISFPTFLLTIGEEYIWGRPAEEAWHSLQERYKRN